MFGFLKKLFGATKPKGVIFSDYWCDSEIKLSYKVRTPLGGSISVIKVCVDIDYEVNDGNIQILTIALAKGSKISGSNTAINVAASRSGEAWFAKSICEEDLLADAVYRDIEKKSTQLKTKMIRKWHAVMKDRNS